MWGSAQRWPITLLGKVVWFLLYGICEMTQKKTAVEMQGVMSAELCIVCSLWQGFLYGVMLVIIYCYYYFIGEERTEVSVFAELCKQDESEILLGRMA